MPPLILWQSPSPRPDAPAILGEVLDGAFSIRITTRERMGEAVTPSKKEMVRIPTPPSPVMITASAETIVLERIMFRVKRDLCFFWYTYHRPSETWYVSDTVVKSRHWEFVNPLA